jgi:carbon monoxide dehydrogenase subunit G
MSLHAAVHFLVVTTACLSGVVGFTQRAPETFTATASVKGSSARASADVRVTVTRFATDAERESVWKAVTDGGTAGAQRALAALPDAGFIQVGEQRTAIKFASRRDTGAGDLITVVTKEPILFLGAGLPDAKPTAGFDVAIAMLEVKDSGGGVGELAPAAKIAIGANGGLVIDDYGGPVIWLNGIARVK